MTDAARTPPKVPRPEPAPVTRSREVEALSARLSASEEQGLPPEERRGRVAALVEDFWRAHPVSPLLEDGAGIECAGAGSAGTLRTVTFLWRDAEAEEVILFANRITDERNLAESLMRRVPGTDVWHLSYRMRSDWRASYGFLPRYPGRAWPWRDGDQAGIRNGLDRCLPDPRNPERCVNRAGTALSVVALPDAPPQPWLARRDTVPRGEVAAHEGPDGRTVWVAPPAATAPGPLPVVIVLDGEVWTGAQDLPTTVGNLVHDGELRPCLLVLPHSGGRERRWAELDGAGGGPAWIADLLLPWIRERYAIAADPGEVVVAGQSLGALTALQTVLERPDAVGAALSQSASLWQHDLDALVDGRDLAGIRVYQEVGAQEWVLRGPNARFAARLADAGANVRFVEYDGGHDYACWRGGIADGLRHLLPADDRRAGG